MLASGRRWREERVTFVPKLTLDLWLYDACEIFYQYIVDSGIVIMVERSERGAAVYLLPGDSIDDIVSASKMFVRYNILKIKREWRCDLFFRRSWGGGS